MPVSQYILFLQTDKFFWFNLIVFLVDIENNYLILHQFGYFLSRIPFLRYLNSMFQWLPLDLWLLTFGDYLGAKLFPTFEIPYMTSYLTSIDTFSLSRTVLEIFDFKVLRGLSWPLIFREHLKSKIFPPVESPYMTSYLTSINTFSSFYLAPFSRYSTSKFLGFDLDHWPKIKNIFTIRKPIHDFLFYLYWHLLSISYRFRDIRLQSF